MPKVFEDFFDEDSSKLFLGIGSILFDNHPRSSLKIVFGSGFGGYTKLPVIDRTWDFFCVRGHRTAAALDLPGAKVAGDSAILINRYRSPEIKKRFKASFIPHFESIHRGQWQAACKIAGVSFVDPRGSVDEVVKHIQESELVIAEAMHGAIVSDALRVPWVPVLPFDPAHHFKWQDWASALELSLRPRKIFPSTVPELTLRYFGKTARKIANLKGFAKQAVVGSNRVLLQIAAHQLERLVRVEPQMSGDLEMERVVSKLEDQAHAIIAKYK